MCLDTLSLLGPVACFAKLYCPTVQLTIYMQAHLFTCSDRHLIVHFDPLIHTGCRRRSKDHRHGLTSLQSSSPWCSSASLGVQIVPCLQPSAALGALRCSSAACSRRQCRGSYFPSGGEILALCRPGDVAWSVGTNEDCQRLLDIVFFRGKLYAIGDYSGQQYLLAIEIVDENGNSEPRVSRIEFIFVGVPITSHCSYLVELHGRLLVICRQIYRQFITFTSL